MHTTTTLAISILPLLLMTACGGPVQPIASLDGGAPSSAQLAVDQDPRDLGLIGDAQEIDPMTATDFLVGPATPTGTP